MASEFRSDLLDGAREFLRGRSTFQDVFMLANDLLPELLGDHDDEAVKAATEIITASDNSARWFSVVAAAFDALAATRPVVKRLVREENEVAASNVIYTVAIAP